MDLDGIRDLIAWVRNQTATDRTASAISRNSRLTFSSAFGTALVTILITTALPLAGSPARKIAPVDDVAISPNSAVCSTCHVSDLARNHMVQNGGDFNAGKAADSTLISSGVETCELCHGAGRSGDVEAVHGVRDFPLN